MNLDEKPRGPSISDIATAADVSIATVSRVINGSAYVKPEIAIKVREAVDRLGYVKLRSARSASVAAVPLVGLMLPDIENPFFASLIKGVQSVAVTRGIDIVLADSGDDPSVASERMIHLIERGARAMLVVAPEGFDAPGKGLEVVRPRGGSVPVVYMDRRPRADGVNYVGSENFQGAYNAAVYLGSLGHRDILYLAGESGLSTEAERYAGFIDGAAMAARSDQAGKPEKPGKACPGRGRLFEQCEFSLEKAHAAVAARIAAGIDFSAVFASDDYMAFGALSALREAGLRVPEDVSLVGFDDLPFSAMIGLTTVRQQAFEIGAAALTLALDLVFGRRSGPQSIVLSTSLVIRGSCSVRERE